MSIFNDNLKRLKDVQNNKYDLIIIGSGPAGLTAGLYANRYKLKTLVVGKISGGLMTESHKICNFPTEQDIAGFDLAKKIMKNVTSQGVTILNDEIIDIKKDGNIFKVKSIRNKNLLTKTVILALGTVHRKLELKNEEKFIGRGLSYCATCDAMFFKNKKVGVVGGSDSALTAALYLSEIANQVYLIYRGKKLRGEPVWVEKISQQSNIKILLETNVKKILGDDKLTSIELDTPYLGKNFIELDGLFIEIGHSPKSNNYIKNLKIEVNEKNYIKVGADQKTTCQGIWAAGDITNNSNNFKQIITACAEGAISAESIFHYIQSL